MEQPFHEAGQLPSLLFPQYGAYVLLYGAHDLVQDVLLQRGAVCSSRFGTYKHDDIAKTPFGSKVYDRRSKKWMAVLRPAAAVAALALSRRTQILYHADVALALSLLEACPGKTICEAGTGSACFTRFLAEAVAPNGRILTFEVNPSRFREAREDCRRLQLQHVVSCFHRDVCCSGFCCTSTAAPRAQPPPNHSSSSSSSCSSVGSSSSSSSSDTQDCSTSETPASLPLSRGDDGLRAAAGAAVEAASPAARGGVAGGRGEGGTAAAADAGADAAATATGTRARRCSTDSRTERSEAASAAVAGAASAAGETSCSSAAALPALAAPGSAAAVAASAALAVPASPASAAASTCAGASAAAAPALPAPKTVDAIFLDLPTPWLALDHAQTTLRSGGRLVVFSPCIEQVQKTCAGLIERRFHSIQTYEILLKTWGVWTAKPAARGRAEEARILAAAAAFESNKPAHTNTPTPDAAAGAAPISSSSGSGDGNSGSDSGSDSGNTDSRSNGRGSSSSGAEIGGDGCAVPSPAAGPEEEEGKSTVHYVKRELKGATDTVPPGLGKAARPRVDTGDEPEHFSTTAPAIPTPSVSLENAVSSFPVLVSHFLKQPLPTAHRDDMVGGGKAPSSDAKADFRGTEPRQQHDEYRQQQQQHREQRQQGQRRQKQNEHQENRQLDPQQQEGFSQRVNHDSEETPKATTTDSLRTDANEGNMSVLTTTKKRELQNVQQECSLLAVERSDNTEDPRDDSEEAASRLKNSSPSAGETIFRPLLDIEYTHYPLPMRGHTGYLTVAIQP